MLRMPLLANVLFSLATAQDAPQSAHVELQPDSKYQQAIASLMQATDADAFARDVRHIDAMGPRAGFFAQLLYFAARPAQNANSRVLLGRVVKQLDVPSHSLVALLAPHLDDRDALVRALARNLIQSCEKRSASLPPDFSAYRAIVEADVRAGRQPQRSLMELMYESDPGSALLTMMRAYQLRSLDELKPILWAEHVVSDLLWRRRFGFADRAAPEPAAVEQLEKLSRHERWWARLYVGHIVAACPELGSPALVARLKADPNRLIREFRPSSARH